MRNSRPIKNEYINDAGFKNLQGSKRRRRRPSYTVLSRIYYTTKCQERYNENNIKKTTPPKKININKHCNLKIFTKIKHLQKETAKVNSNCFKQPAITVLI